MIKNQEKLDTELKKKNTEFSELKEKYKLLLEESKNELKLLEMRNQNKI